MYNTNSEKDELYELVSNSADNLNDPTLGSDIREMWNLLKRGHSMKGEVKQLETRSTATKDINYSKPLEATDHSSQSSLIELGQSLSSNRSRSISF